MRRAIVCVAVLGALAAAGCDSMRVDASRTQSKQAIVGLVKPGGPYTPGVAAGGLVFLSGQLGRDAANNALVAGGTRAETRQAMENLRSLLREAGLDFTDVVKTTVFLSDIKDFADMNEVYGSFFSPGGIPPARSTVQAALPGGARVEIEMIAIRH